MEGLSPPERRCLCPRGARALAHALRSSRTRLRRTIPFALEFDALSLLTLAPGTRLGRYEILSAIGAGGMGEVYRAHDPTLDRQVAIKLLPPETAADPSARQRLRREAMAVAAIDHPYICKIFEIGEQDAALFLVMEYVPGDTLDHRLRSGPLPAAEALRLGGEIAEALEEAHARGILHRDLKPANIMVTPKDT